ncbi:MAG TPA: response regulator [Polyangiaceae bacterium]|nr:response regulator [Polyangiaceae bacterium]
MQVGLLTPPGVLRDFVARAIAPAGHALVTAPDPNALRGLLGDAPEVVLFAPAVAGTRGIAALGQAQKQGLNPARSIYLGLDSRDCAEALQVGFTRALSIPFQGRELLDAVEATGKSALSILLVDDSDLIHRHTLPILQGEGYQVVEAWDGEHALALCAERRFDLILTDVEMPKLDGWEVCRRIKSDPKTEHIPVVICSSLGEASHLEKGFDLGADEYLVKPVVPEELTSRLQSLLASKMLAQRERLLVVDDSAAIRHLVSDCLKRQGFQVTTAVDGQDGLEKAQAEKFELILTDYDMPRMTGFELVVALRRREQTRDIPIVMLTARDTKRDQAQMRAAGLNSYLVKPFGTDKCIALVERVLAEKRLARYKEASRLYTSQGAVQAAEALARSGSLSDVRAKEVDATLLFSDISGFTNMSSKMPPAEVVAILNESFDALCVQIREFGGDIDKFIGDAIMAVFEDRPELDEPHTLRAARAAWAMQQALQHYNASRSDDSPLVMRIGLNAGIVVRGDIGSRFVRRDYTCIGDVVNRAQRHESKAPLGGVLLSADLYARIKQHVEVEEMTGITLKGIDHPVSAFVLKGFKAT